MTAPIVPAGAANLADLLAQWRTVLNGKLSGGVKVKTADTSRSSANTGTTYTDDNHLVIPVLANTVYAVSFHGVYQAHASGQLKVRMTFPSGGTMEAGSWEYDPGTDEAAAATTLSSASPYEFVTGLIGTSANVRFRLEAALHNGANAGDLKLQWAQTLSFATATILRKGSWLQAHATT